LQEVKEIKIPLYFYTESNELINEKIKQVICCIIDDVLLFVNTGSPESEQAGISGYGTEKPETADRSS